jgi:hypothetical protein
MSYRGGRVLGVWDLNMEVRRSFRLLVMSLALQECCQRSDGDLSRVGYGWRWGPKFGSQLNARDLRCRRFSDLWE